MARVAIAVERGLPTCSRIVARGFRPAAYLCHNCLADAVCVAVMSNCRQVVSVPLVSSADSGGRPNQAVLRAQAEVGRGQSDVRGPVLARTVAPASSVRQVGQQ